MINIIYGAKGSGKTKRIIDAANEAKTKGEVVYLTDNDKSLDINPTIRFINVVEYGVCDEKSFEFFLKGMAAANADFNMVFIDGAGRILGKGAEELEQLLKIFEKLSEGFNLDFTVTVSAAEPPKFMKKYI